MKQVHSLASPYPSPVWPEITAAQRSQYFELLCHFLAPLGYRKSPQKPSRRKRKRQKTEHIVTGPREDATTRDSHTSAASPAGEPPSELASHVVIGVNAVLRHLQLLCCSPSLSPTEASKQIAVILLPTTLSESHPLASHLPLLAQLAAERTKTTCPVIVHLDSAEKIKKTSKHGAVILQLFSAVGAHDRLCEVLKLPRVSCVALMSSAVEVSEVGKDLIEMVRREVPPIKCKVELGGEHMPLQVRSSGDGENQKHLQRWKVRKPRPSKGPKNRSEKREKKETSPVTVKQDAGQS